MKKLLMLVGMSLLTACTSLDATKAKEDIREILLPKNQLENSTPMENTKIEEKVEVEKSEWKLSLETMPEVLTSIRMELKNNQKMVFDAKVNKISLYVGQTAVIKDNAGMNKLKLLVSPQKSNPNLKTGSSMFTFRSIYQGTYVVAWETLSGVKKQLTIENHLKYKFTEEENYDIILRSFQEQNLKALEESVALYRMSFSNGKNTRKSMLSLLELATIKKDKKLIRESLQYWSKIQGLNTEESKAVQEGKKIVGLSKILEKRVEKEDIKISVENDSSDLVSGNYEQYKSLYRSANRKATLHLYNAAIKDYQKALIIGKKFPETVSIYDGLGNSYYGLGKYQQSIEYFQKSLSHKGNSSERRAETYYKLASAYNKLGEKREYKKYLTLLKERYANSLWGKKAQIELMKLNER
ncbi:tetratricopeptide repeat protein [Fusobacterium equinum]|uniref:Tetratricopeptide repeat protein n=1 Tax=Fusobacterium equinum TaxID=134605 RepID=A0A133N9Z3_9FUSO|nr:tetratricopeptide repeat protein [Fusobacterium equinum]KXA13111.1 tetratricopeptide repeat protein [Fusobacterium equinum]